MDTKALFPTGPATGSAPKIFDFIIANDIEEIKFMLQDPQIDVNEGDEDHLTPLHLAVELEKEEIVRSLIENGAVVNRFTLDLKLTPLHIAVRNGSTCIADCLLANNADINCKNKLDHTPLHVAVSTKNIEMTRLLLFWGADPNIRTQDPRRESPLLKAATISGELTSLLLDSGAKLSHESKELHVSILANKPEIANIILDHITEPCHLMPNRIGRTPLQSVASHVGNCEPKVAANLMVRLLRLGDDVNYVNQFGGVFHILIARCVNFVDPVAVACFDYLLNRSDSNCDKIAPSSGSPLTLAFRLNQFAFAIKLIKVGFADVREVRLDLFKFSLAAVPALRMLFFSGHQFQPLFREQNKPHNPENDLREQFGEFCDWLEEGAKSVHSLKSLVRIHLRTMYKKRTLHILNSLEFPHILTRFVMFDDM